MRHLRRPLPNQPVTQHHSPRADLQRGTRAAIVAHLGEHQAGKGQENQGHTAHKEPGVDGRPFYREGMIATEDDLERMKLPDPHGEE